MDRYVTLTVFAGALVRVVAPGPGRWIALLAALAVLLPAPRLPSRAWTVGHLLAIAVAAGIALSDRAEEGLGMLVAWLLVHRAWTAPTDARPALLFATGLALLGCLGTESAVQAPPLLLFLALLPGALLRAQAGAQPLARTLTLGLVSLALTAGLFLLLPRLRGGYFSAESTPPGFAADVVLGDELDLDDQALVLRARVTDREGRPVPGPFHFRGKVFDQFDGRAWTSTVPPEAAPRPDPAADRWAEIELEPLVGGVLFGPPEVVGVTRLNGGALRDENGSWFHRLPPARIRYTAHVRSTEDPGVLPLPAARAAALTALPDLDGRVRALAWSLAPEAREPEALAGALSAWLSSEMTYTARPPPTGADPVAGFLFETRTGHCEYFATVLAVLLRERGVPARLATGFWSGEVDEEGRVVVRRGQAHAWVEVPTARGWVVVDPSPVEARPTEPPSTFAAWWSRAQDRWARWVIDYNLDTQLQGLEGLGRRTSEAAGLGTPDRPTWVGVNLLGGVLVGLYAVAVLVQFVAERVVVPPTQGRPDALAGELLRARRLLARRGVEPPALPAGELARWLQHRDPEAAGPFLRVVEAVYGARYGGADPLGALRSAREARRSLGKLPRRGR